MSRHIKKSVNKECTSANHRGHAHSLPRALCKGKATAQPPSEEDEKKKWNQSAHFHRRPEPIALRMDSLVRGEVKLPVRRKNGPKISQPYSQQGRLFK